MPYCLENGLFAGLFCMDEQTCLVYSRLNGSCFQILDVEISLFGGSSKLGITHFLTYHQHSPNVKLLNPCIQKHQQNSQASAFEKSYVALTLC
jgi:hypothetical protein